jgi:hypothetical protein
MAIGEEQVVEMAKALQARRLPDDYTHAKVTPAWSGARPMAIPPWLWFRYARFIRPSMRADGQKDYEDADAFEAFCAETMPVPVCSADFDLEVAVPVHILTTLGRGYVRAQRATVCQARVLVGACPSWPSVASRAARQAAP